MTGPWAITLIQVVSMLIGGPLLVGWMRRVRCRMEGRMGAPVHQPLLDLRKQLRRERTRPTEASWIFGIAPVAFVASAATVAALVPIVGTGPAEGHSADLVAVVFLLLLGTVAIGLGALDAGTSFGGMGSSRAMMIAALAEPALLVAILALSIPARSSNLPAVVLSVLAHPIWLARPQRLLALGALVVVVLAESGRLPVDNPATHLELTMVHEAMVLEYAGPDLALVTIGESMRLAVLLGLLANLFVPWGIATRNGGWALLVGWVVAIAKVGALGGAIAAFEVFIAKIRLFRVPELMAGAFVLSVLAVVTSMVGS